MKHRGFELISAYKYLEKIGVSALYSLSHSMSHSTENNMVLYTHFTPRNPHVLGLPYTKWRKELDMMIAIITLIKAFIVGIVVGITYIIYLLLKYYLDK